MIQEYVKLIEIRIALCTSKQRQYITEAFYNGPACYLVFV